MDSMGSKSCSGDRKKKTAHEVATLCQSFSVESFATLPTSRFSISGFPFELLLVESPIKVEQTERVCQVFLQIQFKRSMRMKYLLQNAKHAPRWVPDTNLSNLGVSGRAARPTNLPILLILAKGLLTHLTWQEGSQLARSLAFSRWHRKHRPAAGKSTNLIVFSRKNEDFPWVMLVYRRVSKCRGSELRIWGRGLFSFRVSFWYPLWN